MPREIIDTFYRLYPGATSVRLAGLTVASRSNQILV